MIFNGSQNLIFDKSPTELTLLFQIKPKYQEEHFIWSSRSHHWFIRTMKVLYTEHCPLSKGQIQFSPYFSSTGPLTTCAFLVCLWRALVHHKLRPLLIYSRGADGPNSWLFPTPTHPRMRMCTHTHNEKRKHRDMSVQSHSLSMGLVRVLAIHTRDFDHHKINNSFFYDTASCI